MKKSKLNILNVALGSTKGLMMIILLITLGFKSSVGQVYSNKELKEKDPQGIDSLKLTDYPYALPIWGAKAAKLGFDLPYSAGIGVNYLWQESDLIIENLKVGFNYGPLYDLDEIVRFNNATSRASAVNIRPDIWLFPFLNVYGVFAKSQLSTLVDFGIWVPDATGTWNETISFSTEANFDATSIGFGLTPTIGVAGGWMALDMNFTWTDIAELEKPAFSFIFGPRLGKSFKLKKPGRNIAIWTGGFRLSLNSGTSGSLPLSDALPDDDLQGKVDDGIAKVENGQVEVDAWWDELSTIEQNSPINKAKYETANRALASAGNVLNSMDSALNDDEYATVQYSLDKRPKDMWNFLLGAQYQHSKHLMVRVEAGFLGSRTQVIAGLQYRFGL